MSRTARIGLGVALMALTAGCSLDQAGAAVSCEDFVERRVGTGLTFWPVDRYEVIGESLQWTVHHGFNEPNSGGETEFLCTVVDEGNQWRLIDMTTNRTVSHDEWASTLRDAGFQNRP